MTFKCSRIAICPYKKELDKIKEELAYIRFELEELKAQRYKGKKKPQDDDGSPPAQKKKRGGVFGHIGWFRKKPKHVHEVQELTLKRCPYCKSSDLNEYEEPEEHVQEDICLPQVKITLYKKHHYYCRRCQKVVTAQGVDELPHSYIGPKAKALAVFMKYIIKASDRNIKDIFEKVFNLNLVPSSVCGFRDQLRKRCYPWYKKLEEALKRSRFIHGDETGWNIDGKNGWLWKFANNKICISHIDESRGQKVVEQILGTDYDGVLISDFYAAYNKITTKAKQRCLVHLLRDLKKVIKYWHDDAEVLRYAQRLKDVLKQAIYLHKEYADKPWNKRYYALRKIITESLDDFSFPNPNKKILQRFVKRLNRHKQELFTFLYEKGIAYHNNHIERQIRPDVILRKVTFGNRSIKGAHNHSVLMSMVQTAKLNNIDPLAMLQKVLISPSKIPFPRAVIAPP
jgi:transposase